MEATLEKPQYLNVFEGKTSEEIREAVHEIDMIRAKTLGHLAAIVMNAHTEMRHLTWNGIDSGFDPEETYISVTQLQKIIARLEASTKEANERYSVIGGGKLIYL